MKQQARLLRSVAVQKTAHLLTYGKSASSRRCANYAHPFSALFNPSNSISILRPVWQRMKTALVSIQALPKSARQWRTIICLLLTSWRRLLSSLLVGACTSRFLNWQQNLICLTIWLALSIKRVKVREGLSVRIFVSRRPQLRLWKRLRLTPYSSKKPMRQRRSRLKQYLYKSSFRKAMALSHRRIAFKTNGSQAKCPRK